MRGQLNMEYLSPTIKKRKKSYNKVDIYNKQRQDLSILLHNLKNDFKDLTIGLYKLSRYVRNDLLNNPTLTPTFQPNEDDNLTLQFCFFDYPFYITFTPSFIYISRGRLSEEGHLIYATIDTLGFILDYQKGIDILTETLIKEYEHLKNYNEGNLPTHA